MLIWTIMLMEERQELRRTLGAGRTILRAYTPRKLTWKPKKGPTKTTVLLKGDYLGFHVSLGECGACSCVGFRDFRV